MAMIRFTERPPFRNPWAEFERIRQGLDELSRNMNREGKSRQNGSVFPPLKIYEDAESLLIRAELPGVRVEDLDISIEGETLTLQGSRNHTPDEKDVSYHRREIQNGTFSRAVALPARIDTDNITAKLVDGILTVRLKKANVVGSRHITITTE